MLATAVEAVRVQRAGVDDEGQLPLGVLRAATGRRVRLHRLQVTAFGPFAGDRRGRPRRGLGRRPLPHPRRDRGGQDQPARRRRVRVVCRRPRRPLEEAAAQRPRGARSRAVGDPRVHRRWAPPADRAFAEFLRPKARGRGETKVQAKAVLWERRGAEWVALSTRHDEIADVVKDVLGMGLEQFSKVVLLPQGDFAAFLRATPEERRSLLERLFDVSSFAGIEDWFAVQRKDDRRGRGRPARRPQRRPGGPGRRPRGCPRPRGWLGRLVRPAARSTSPAPSRPPGRRSTRGPRSGWPRSTPPAWPTRRPRPHMPWPPRQSRGGRAASPPAPAWPP